MRSARRKTASMPCSTRMMVSRRLSARSSAIMRCDSSMPMQAIGSSSSSRRGRVASAIATSSWRCSPCERLAARMCCLSVRPTSLNTRLAGSVNLESCCAGRQKRKLCPACACTARATLSSAVNSGNTLVIWNERARPLRERRGADRRVMSSPAKRMLPASGRRLPASWLMRVVLPAPLGPMTACVSPSPTSKPMPSLARRAPKLFDKFSTERRLFMARKNARETVPEEDHRQHQQRAEDHLPVFGEALQHLLGEQQREGAEHRAGGGAHSAEDHHEHQLARLQPAHQAWRD